MKPGKKQSRHMATWRWLQLLGGSVSVCRVVVVLVVLVVMVLEATPPPRPGQPMIVTLEGKRWAQWDAQRTASSKNGCTCLSLRSACRRGTHTRTHSLAAICFRSPISCLSIDCIAAHPVVLPSNSKGTCLIDWR
ncbi:hypothetical protein K456DRAFT_1441891 [Colletotrichum gloeosporioides 23]|nr:hypothetical protein K456DRAFT_1441891 [Colletotrichum gloeosporioides 23]